MQWFESLDNVFLLPLGEEINGLVDSHVEHVGNVLAMESHLEDVALEALAVAMLTLEDEVGHKLHLDGDDSRTLTFITPSAVGIK